MWKRYGWATSLRAFSSASIIFVSQLFFSPLYPGILSPVSVPLSGNVMRIEDRGDNSVAEVHYGQFTEREIRLVSESVFLNNPAFVSSSRLWRDLCVYREGEERRRDREGGKEKNRCGGNADRKCIKEIRRNKCIQASWGERGIKISRRRVREQLKRGPLVRYHPLYQRSPLRNLPRAPFFFSLTFF